MVSMWGSKSGEGRENEGGETQPEEQPSPARHSGGPEPGERTRLLPPHNDGYLDPDDPAVRKATIEQGDIAS